MTIWFFGKVCWPRISDWLLDWLSDSIQSSRDFVQKNKELDREVVELVGADHFRNGSGKKPNLATRMQKFIRQAGLKPWPKLFQNLRTSRQTELAKRFPEYVVCEWIGNSQIVAREHYLRVTEDDFACAASEEWLAKWLANGAGKSEQNGHSPGIAQSSLLLQIVQKVSKEQGLE